MSKKLAIKGHATRGNEVIEILKMLGGKNTEGYIGIDYDEIYTIEDGYIIQSYDWNDYLVLSLEEFLKKFPYKVGDKVVYTKFGDNCDDYPVTIESMKWTGTTIEYTFNDCVTCLAKDLKMWNGEPDAVISGIYLNSYDYADKVELYLGDYEIEVRDGKTFAVKKKPKYLTTYEECCKALNLTKYPPALVPNKSMFISQYKDFPHYYEIQKLAELLICRDAYWKIAGEQMGLGKPWKPDWENSEEKRYCIVNIEGDINLPEKILTKWILKVTNKLLVFPTEEMRDAFYKNFKNLIESCKELL